MPFHLFRPDPVLRPLSTGLWTLVALLAACGPVPETAAGEAERPAGPADGRQEAPSATPGPDPIARYLALPPPDSAEAERVLEALEEALDEWDEGNRAGPARRAHELLARLPALEDWRPLILAELLAPAGDTAGVRRALDELDPATGFRSRWGWRFLSEAHEEADDVPGAIRTALEFAATEEDPGHRAEAGLRAGRLLLDEGDTASAAGSLRAALAVGPAHRPAREAARILDRIEAVEGTEEALRVGRALLAAGDWRGAHARLVDLVREEGPASRDGELRLGVGRALVELGRHGEARAHLDALLRAGTTPEIEGAALYWVGRAALGGGDVGGAETAFRRLADRLPESPHAERGFLTLLERELETGFGPRARSFLNELLRVGVGTASAELVVVRLGSELYLRGDYEGAALTFEEYLAGSRRAPGRQQAAYWSALAHARAGQPARAEERFARAHRENPYSFYGVLAGERVSAPVLPEDLGEGPSPVPGLEPELRNALLRLRVHQLVPTEGSFAHELDRLVEHFHARGDGRYDLAEALIEGELPLQGIVLGRDIHRDEGEWNLRLLRIVHPFPHRDVIVREARGRGLNPFFVAGLIRQESMFHRRIVSPAGAVGLMQLMPGTAREVAASVGIPYAPSALTDPETNVRLGTAFLADVLRRFDGRAEDALAAYNAGPGRMWQWRQRPVYGDRDVFMEHIPFAETRHYVKVVQQYARVYAALYGCGEFEPCLGLSYPEVVARSPLAGGSPAAGQDR